MTRQAHAGELLFEIPYGFRPTGPVTRPLVDEQGFRFDVQVSPEGRVAYGPQPRGADGEALDGYEQVTYHTTVTWTTQEDPRIEASGHYGHLPAGRDGIYRLVRRGNTVSAWLEADATPVPVWYRPASAVPLAQLSVHPDTPLLRSYWAPDLNVYRVRYTDKIGRLDHDPAYPYPKVRYDIVGRSCCFMSSNPFNPINTGYDWLIRFGDNEVGWVDGNWVRIHGDASDVPVVTSLFALPIAFRPAQDIHWVVQAQPVDAQGQALAGLSGTELEFRVSSGGHVRYAPGFPLAEAGHKRYAAAATWTVAADVCQRSRPVQRAILRALNHTDHHLAACSRVTWADLASIQTLELYPYAVGGSLPPYRMEEESYRDNDLSGLSQLRHLHIRHDFNYYDGSVSVSLPPKLLAHVPRLQTLTLDNVALSQLPDGLLIFTPQLQILNQNPRD